MSLRNGIEDCPWITVEEAKAFRRGLSRAIREADQYSDAAEAC